LSTPDTSLSSYQDRVAARPWSNNGTKSHGKADSRSSGSRRTFRRTVNLIG
jgi:hypothetical protein